MSSSPSNPRFVTLACPAVEGPHRASKGGEAWYDRHRETRSATTSVADYCPTPADAKAGEEGQPAYSYDLHVSRSQPRLKSGEIAFECEYWETGYPVKVPLSAFFDAEGWCTDFDVCSAINDWCAKAKEYPTVRRKCIMCKCKATKGFVVCGKCDKTWGSAIYAPEE